MDKETIEPSVMRRFWPLAIDLREDHHCIYNRALHTEDE
jgi:hypothetical protein